MDRGDQTVLEFVRRHALRHRVSQVYLFGSRARRDHHARSDFDFAVEAPNLDELEWAQFAVDLRESIPTLCAVDLVRLDFEVAPELARRIQIEGQALLPKGSH